MEEKRDQLFQPSGLMYPSISSEKQKRTVNLLRLNTECFVVITVDA